MQAYELRQATEQDYGFLWELVVATMREYVTAIWGWDEKWQSERYRNNFHPDQWKIIVIGGVDAGAFEATWKDSELFLAKLYVAPAFQRQGIGTSIVRSLRADADAAGLPLKLDVLRSNPDAKRLYERLSLKVVGETAERFHMSSSGEK